MKRQIYILPLIALFFQVHFIDGQDSSATFKNQIKFSPSATVNFFDNGLELSYERLFSKKVSAEISAMYFVDLFKMNFNEHTNIHGGRLSIAGKYFYTANSIVRQYFASDLTYDKSTFNTIERFGSQTWLRDSVSYANSYLDSILVNRTGVSFNLRWGLQISIIHLIIDLSAGIGAKRWDITHDGRINQSDKLGAIWHKGYSYETIEQGRRFTYNIPISLKIGYVF
ncbi:MAG: hypothetical protein V1781_07640 [Bacteroidota bacterium]